MDDDEEIATADALEMMAAACLSDLTDNPMPELAELLNEGASCIREQDARIASDAKRIRELEEIARDVAKMQLIDAEEDSKRRVVFRFYMPGNELLNPPKFLRAARRAMESG